MTFPAFGSVRYCLKCGKTTREGDTLTKYMPEQGGILKRQCGRCGYLWFEATVDITPAYSPDYPPS